MNSLRSDDKGSIISKILYTITLLAIIARRYAIFIIRDGIVPSTFMSALFYGSFVLLLLQFAIQKSHNKTEIIIFLATMMLYLLTREGSILMIVLLAIAIKNIEDDYVVKSYIILNLIFIVGSIIIGNLMPHIAPIPEAHYRIVEGELVSREAFGFANPNSPFWFTLAIYAGYIFLRFDDYNKYDRILLIFTTIFIYYFTKSRTGAIAIFGALVFVELLKKIDLKDNILLTKGLKLIPFIFLVSSLLVGTVFAKVSSLNSLMASRPRHWNAYLVKNGNLLTLFGNKYSSEIKAAHPLDSSYVYMYAFLGLVSLIFFMYLLYKGLDLFIINDQKKYIAIVMMFLIYALAENILLEVGYNFTIVLLIKHIIINNKDNFTIFNSRRAG
ncbi:hypothetical protein [Asaccharospora irregularis]|uniref:Polysaccharide polymerase n=1 Tax=Asaccharospora irregularis DSM 2635 TaxID=1121321 RepID=A0A1M5PU55_9FIRM|nr:hypothetical protein [Asaccharospora irregularis]SHH05150.1 hypothetical protein SAMN04488530_11614 [Asaccharospora irregularis DSM 2635]